MINDNSCSHNHYLHSLRTAGCQEQQILTLARPTGHRSGHPSVPQTRAARAVYHSRAPGQQQCLSRVEAKPGDWGFAVRWEGGAKPKELPSMREVAAGGRGDPHSSSRVRSCHFPHGQRSSWICHVRSLGNSSSVGWRSLWVCRHAERGDWDLTRCSGKRLDGSLRGMGGIGKIAPQGG